MQDIILQPSGVMDPRGRPGTNALPLAPRLPTLAGRQVLLVDHRQRRAHSDHKAVILHTVVQRLRQQYGAQCRRLSHDVRSLQQASVRGLARQIMQAGAEAVVLALGDAGVTAHTIVLAWELERHGVPTVTLCTGQHIYLAAAMSLPVMPGLPLSQLTIRRQASPTDIAAEVIWVLGEVVEALTAAPDVLHRQFLEKFAPGGGRLHADTAGELHLWPAQRLPITDPRGSVITYDPAAYAADLYETLCEHGMCDGLPVIPPTRARVEAMLGGTDRLAEDVLVPQCFPSGLPLTVGTLAVNAVLAGCRPDYFPILLTAAEAIAEPRYRLLQATITSHPAGNAIIVSGPLAQEIGLASGGGCLGPGFRANMTIGRALHLSLLNVGRALPGLADLSTMGSAAELTFCVAEHVQASPWPPLHVDCFDAETTSVTVLKCESPHNVLDRLSTSAEGILRGIADVAATLGGNNAYVPAELLVLLNPEHAQIIHADGWSKADVQRYLYEQARNPRHGLAGRGVVPVRPADFEALDDVPVVRSPEEVMVVVAGANGPHSMVGIPWGYSRAVTKAVTLHSGAPARHISDFRGAKGNSEKQLR
jgi:hypothetical protein